MKIGLLLFFLFRIPFVPLLLVLSPMRVVRDAEVNEQRCTYRLMNAHNQQWVSRRFIG
ncbi:hypothetical protein M434DRAFT_401293 [Hypoxylon sp. CO27-5]|nr:hypothetical protein M434DRAFT_401293 [Hypoxylon sp. CO27-5]